MQLPPKIMSVATTVVSRAVSAKYHARSRRNAIVLWHLLSLDAPTVATLWTWFFAAANHVQLPVSSVGAMAVAVWMLYAADRLLDTRWIGSASQNLAAQYEERHLFHRANSRFFISGIVLGSILLAFLLPRLPPASTRLYGVLGAMLFFYFILIHAAGSLAYRLPKELAVGAFFSAATFIPTVAREPALRSALLPAAVLFAVLCSLNCLFIYSWEHPAGSSSAHPSTQLALRFLAPISAIVIVSGLTLTILPHLAWQIPLACAGSSALLICLNSQRERFASSVLRAAADLCLLTPLLFLFSFR